MTNQIYQVTLSELESVLSPRVVSHLLNEGLVQIGQSPQTVSFDGMEMVLKAQIYRQLQASLPAVEAKAKIASILERLQPMHGDPPGNEDQQPNQTPEFEAEPVATEPVATGQEDELAELKSALKPFNLYFEWPETQKLRAQVKLLEKEVKAGRDGSKLIVDARQQLETLNRKLEDQLVSQAKDLGDLKEDFEKVKSLGSDNRKVMRLENLIEQINTAQQQRQLVPAEVERARKRATDLKKLMESSIFNADMVEVADEAIDIGGILDVEEAEDDILTIDTEGLSPEVSAKLLLLDVENERIDLETIEQEFSSLLQFKPELRGRFGEARANLEHEISIADDLGPLRDQLSEAKEALRLALELEFAQMQGEAEQIEAEVDQGELTLALQVALSILEATLPAEADVQQARNLFKLAQEKSQAVQQKREQELAERQAKLTQQVARFNQLRASFERHKELSFARTELASFSRALKQIVEAHQAGQYVPDLLDQASQIEASIEAAIAEQANDDLERERAQVRNLLNRVQALPQVAELKAKAEGVTSELHKQLENLQAASVGEAQINVIAGLVDNLAADIKTTFQRKLSQLIDRVGMLGNKALLIQLQEANQAVEEANYPDLSKIENDVQAAIEARRAEQIAEVHQIANESRQYRGLETEELKELEQLLESSQEAIKAGQVVENLDRAWMLLEAVRNEVTARAANFAPRLNEALASFISVSVLNNENTAQVRRILNHLDSQREAFAKVSLGVQSRLEESLTEAELLLIDLESEHKATAEVAGKADALLDGLFGGLGSSAAKAEPKVDVVASASPEPVAAKAATQAEPPASDGASTTEIRSGNEIMNMWVDGYLQERGVCGAALYGGDETMKSGKIDFNPDALSDALVTFERDLKVLSEELTLGNMELLSVETPKYIVIVTWPTELFRFVLVLDTPTALSLIVHKLRRDLPGIAELLSGPAFA